MTRDTTDVEGVSFVGRQAAFIVTWWDGHSGADANTVYLEVVWAYTAP